MWASRRRSNGSLVRLIGAMRLLSLAVAISAVVSLPTAARASPPNGADSPELRRFENCTELEQYLEQLAVEQVRRQMEQWRQWGYRRGRYGLKSSEAASAAPSAAPSMSKGDGEGRSSGPSAHTETNVQVGGVGEADLVKRGGT